jgi:hypothetical protein
MRTMSAALAAKRLLHDAALQLGTANPARFRPISDVLDLSMPYPVGDRAYRNSRPLETNFNEMSADSLAFVMDPGGPRTSADDRVEIATRAMGDIVAEHFGRGASHWLDSRTEGIANSHGFHSFGASFGSALDREGMRESYVSYEWGPGVMDALPPLLARVSRVAMDLLPGLRPALSTVRCGRSAGTQQVSFTIDRALALEDLQPLMDELGLGKQHAGLMSTAAFLMGARFTLPPDTATITLRPTRHGIEMRLDVDLDSLPDPPERLLPLLQMQLTERPASTRAFNRWLVALTSDGYPGPGNVTVLSILVRPEMPARVAIYLRPYVLDASADQRSDDRGSSLPGNGEDRSGSGNGRDYAPDRPAPVGAVPGAGAANGNRPAMANGQRYSAS